VLLNQAAEIVAEQLAQDLIDHGRVGLAHDGIAEIHPFLVDLPPVSQEFKGDRTSLVVVVGLHRRFHVKFSV
jgi:hypothetical protein